MIEEHPRPGKAHDGTDLLAHFRLVAMHFAVWAKGFCFHKRAVITSASGINIQFLALRAQLSLFCMVISATIETDHFGDDSLLALPLRFYIHSGSLSLCCAARRLAASNHIIKLLLPAVNPCRKQIIPSLLNKCCNNQEVRKQNGILNSNFANWIPLIQESGNRLLFHTEKARPWIPAHTAKNSEKIVKY